MPEPLSESEAKMLLAFARRSIEAELRHQHLNFDLEACPEALRQSRAPFVTLYNRETLRGCIGTLLPEASLVEEVVRLAPAAAHDRRFKPVTKNELPELTISLSVLTPPQDLLFEDEADLAEKLRPGVDGLILCEGLQRGTLLPQVWENITSPREFIRVTKEKAGLDPDEPSPNLRAQVYQAEHWSE